MIVPNAAVTPERGTRNPINAAAITGSIASSAPIVPVGDTVSGLHPGASPARA
jgi:hypothetical protein